MSKKKGTQKQEQKPIPAELTKRVQSLWDNDQESAKELGKALEEVKECNPREFGKWIAKNLGNSVSILNRCNYCLSVFRGKKGKGSRKGSQPIDTAFGRIILEVKEHFKHLYDYAQEGDVDSADAQATKITEKAAELVETAKSNAAKLSKKELAKTATA